MLYGILKVLLDKYKVNKIMLIDNSYWRGPNGSIPLPERRVLSGKPTWYQEYFGAVCLYENYVLVYKEYEKKRAEKMTPELASAIGISPRYVGYTVQEVFQKRYTKWTEDQIRKTLHVLELPSLSGQTWTIPKKQVKSYRLPIQWIEDGQWGGNRESETYYIRQFKNRTYNYTFYRGCPP